MFARLSSSAQSLVGASRGSSRIVLLIGALTVVSGCASPPKAAPAAERASGAGHGLWVAEPTFHVVDGTACSAGTTDGIPARFAATASKAMTNAGFSLLDGGTREGFVLNLDLEVDYCSDAGIVSGTTTMTLLHHGNAIWTARALGDQAKGETAASTIAELVDGMLLDPTVVRVTKQARP